MYKFRNTYKAFMNNCIFKVPKGQYPLSLIADLFPRGSTITFDNVGIETHIMVSTTQKYSNEEVGVFWNKINKLRKPENSGGSATFQTKHTRDCKVQPSSIHREGREQHHRGQVQQHGPYRSSALQSHGGREQHHGHSEPMHQKSMHKRNTGSPYSQGAWRDPDSHKRD
jgi:hypothetical protein